jgi:hypothetical protein
MVEYHIIDRRENPKGKNLPNREKFLKKVRKQVHDQVRGAMNKKSITDANGTDITIPSGGISEPSFEYDHSTGEWDRILPGNETFSKGDKIKRPTKSSSGGGGQGSADGEGEDNFTFTLTREEYLDIVFDDLELPDLIRTVEQAAIVWHRMRAGFKTDGNPSQLDLVRSLKNSLGRRLALRNPIRHQIEDLEAKLLQDDTNKEEILLEIESLKRRHSAIPWVDPMDLRFRRWDRKPIPNSQAVMFCLMDVSASMGETEKNIAKRFYLLLYLFLQRQYEKIQVVFIRHTHVAKEVDEFEFFNSKESGGTVVSSGLELVNKIIIDRYPQDAWNIYVVQASDGDNSGSDNIDCRKLLDEILPKVQYYVYAEVKQGFYMYGTISTGLWKMFEEIVKNYPQLAVVSVPTTTSVVNIFRQIFAKKAVKKTA